MRGSIVRPASPRTSDGRDLVVPSRFGPGLDPYITGAGDDLATGERGGGTALEFSAVTTDQSLEWGYVDAVRIASGGLAWTGGKVGDCISMWLAAKTAPLTSTPDAGNCLLVPTGAGFNLVVPTEGGTHTVDLGTANLVPNESGLGYWDWVPPDLGAGTVTPNASREGGWDMFDEEIDLVCWVNRLPMIGDGVLPLDPQSIDRKIYARWTWRATVHSETQHGGLSGAFYLNLARSKTT